MITTRKKIKIVVTSLDSVADLDPGSGAFLPPGSGIRDGAMIGSGINNEIC
jgi:hypothetical protein